MRNDSAAKVRMASLEDLLGIGQPSMERGGRTAAVPEQGQITEVPLEKLHTFHSHIQGHPFRVLDDSKMAETVESVKTYGVLVPGIVRPDREYPGEYELISGHRRCRASMLAGLSDMPVIIREMSDAEATVIMVDANIQREDLLASERAWAYRMRYEAMKELGVTESGLRNDQQLARELGESRNTIQRYIRLTYLVPELLAMVDADRLSKLAAVELSYLREEEQEELPEVMEELCVIPSLEQAKRLKELSRECDFFGTDVMRTVFTGREERFKIALPAKKIRSFFPESYTGEQIREIIYRLLEEWQTEAGHRV